MKAERRGEKKKKQKKQASIEVCGEFYTTHSPNSLLYLRGMCVLN